VNAAYRRSVLAAGGVPVILSPLLGPSYAPRALDGVDGLLLSGGEDLDPAWYGAEQSPSCYPPSRERDLFELALFAAARQRELPILGICRGIQLVNVGLGGSLFQDLPTELPGPLDHNVAAPRSARSHEVRLAPGSRAAAALGAERVGVNSFHHQAVRDLAPALVASG
jgi:putative glutamine amidotransferase